MVNIAVTLLLVLVGWVLFYYENLGDALNHLKVMFGLSGAAWSDPSAVYYGKHYVVFLVAAALASLPWKTYLQKLPHKPALDTAARWLKPLVVTALFLLALGMIVTQSYNPFLYFRF